MPALALERLGKELFVVAVVMIGRVDKIHADVDGPMKHGNRLLFVSIAELALKRRTAVADG